MLNGATSVWCALSIGITSDPAGIRSRLGAGPGRSWAATGGATSGANPSPNARTRRGARRAGVAPPAHGRGSLPAGDAIAVSCRADKQFSRGRRADRPFSMDTPAHAGCPVLEREGFRVRAAADAVGCFPAKVIGEWGAAP